MIILWSAIYLVLILQISNFCTTTYLHRSLAHRSIHLSPPVVWFMELWLWMHVGINPRQWVAVHRKHHAFSDQEGDPHSPKLEGVLKVFLTNVFLYRKEAANPDTVERFTRDLPENWRERYILKLGTVGMLLGLALAILVLGIVAGTIVFLLQGILYILLNGAINSFCHAVGYRNFDNEATNIRWLAWITAGEGLHNNHHHAPASPRLGRRGRWEFDPAWPVIRLLTLLRLARVKRT